LILNHYHINQPIFQKVAQTVSKPKKCQNMYIKAQLESSKHGDPTTFEAFGTQPVQLTRF
jgi:hypothetical protein